MTRKLGSPEPEELSLREKVLRLIAACSGEVLSPDFFATGGGARALRGLRRPDGELLAIPSDGSNGILVWFPVPAHVPVEPPDEHREFVSGL